MLATTSDYLVSHGSSGGFGRFTAAAAGPFRRGERVVVQSPRGLEMGVVLCAVTPGHAQLLSTISGRLLRQAAAEDEAAQEQLGARRHQLFDECRRLAGELRLPLEILDVELLLDNRLIVQYLAAAETDLTPLVETLTRRHGLEIRLESLEQTPAVEEEEHGGCGQPGCGRAEGGSCTSCGSGGCSSCGTGPVDLRAYFAHLRTQMEQQHSRTPLL